MHIIADDQIPYLDNFFPNNPNLKLISSNNITPSELKSADVLFVRSVTNVNKALLHDSSIRFVGSMTAGIDHLDTAYLDQQKIAWAHAPGCNAYAVADYILLALAQLFTQGKLTHDKQLRAGVVGVGNVGRQVANRLKKIGFEVLLNDPPRATDEPDFVSTPLSQFADLDLICLHTPLTNSGPFPTHQLFSASFLDSLSDKTIIINAGRGECIDVEAMKRRKLTCIFDVWPNEPAIDFELLQQCFLATPHIAGYTEAAKFRATQQIYQAFCNHFEVDHYLEIPEPAQHFMELNLSNASWIDKAIASENLLSLSEQLKSANEASIASVFSALRKNYQFREEFA